MEGLILGGAYLRKEICFKIDWTSIIVGSKFTVFALFYFVFEGNFPRISPQGAYIWRGYLTEGFLRYRLYIEGLIFGILRYRDCSTSHSRAFLYQRYFMLSTLSSAEAPAGYAN